MRVFVFAFVFVLVLAFVFDALFLMPAGGPSRHKGHFNKQTAHEIHCCSWISIGQWTERTFPRTLSGFAFSIDGCSAKTDCVTNRPGDCDVVQVGVAVPRIGCSPRGVDASAICQLPLRSDVAVRFAVGLQSAILGRPSNTTPGQDRTGDLQRVRLTS